MQCGVSELNDQRHFKLDFVVMGWDMVAAGLVGQTAAAAIVSSSETEITFARLPDGPATTSPPRN